MWKLTLVQIQNYSHINKQHKTDSAVTQTKMFHSLYTCFSNMYKSKVIFFFAGESEVFSNPMAPPEIVGDQDEDDER